MHPSTALLPLDEAERLASLRHYDTLAAASESIFHELVALTAHIFQVQMAFLAFVDRHEVLLPVLYGLPPQPPLPRGEALCSMAVLYPHAVVYENLAVALQDASEGRAIRAALANGVHFYAGAPLRMPDDHRIGVLCVASLQARPFSSAEQQVLEALADVVSLTIAVRHVCVATPELGRAQWESVQHQLRADVCALRCLLNQLLVRYGAWVPGHPAVLYALQQRLQALRLVLSE
jgi:transcriptional regulator with GAF, ATPase, and Fis domain